MIHNSAGNDTDNSNEHNGNVILPTMVTAIIIGTAVLGSSLGLPCAPLLERRNKKKQLIEES